MNPAAHVDRCFGAVTPERPTVAAEIARPKNAIMRGEVGRHFWRAARFQVGGRRHQHSLKRYEPARAEAGIAEFAETNLLSGTLKWTRRGPLLEISTVSW